METIIENAHYEHKAASEAVKHWISDVQEIARQAEELVVECKGENPSWHDTCDRGDTQNIELKNEARKKGRVKNPIRRLQVGRLATKLLARAEELLHCRNDLVVLVPCIRPSNYMAVRANGMEFGSRNDAMRQIIGAIKEEKVYVIGVYGPCGIGKSVLVNQILVNMSNQREFDQVIKINLGRKPGLDEIKMSIAKQLNSKRTILLLDNAWEGLDLLELGLPVEVFKILVTTQKISVCKSLGANVEVMVDFLTEQESWELFKFKAGLYEQSAGIGSVEEKIAKRCGHLPLALDVIGTAMCGKDKMYWEGALAELESSYPLENAEVLQKIYMPLKLSYLNLERDEKKALFLMCSLFPGGHEISEDELTAYWVGEDAFNEFHTLEESRRKIHMRLTDIKDSFLLQPAANGSEYVMMHNVVRDVAVFIASRLGEQFAAPHEISEAKINVELKKCKRLSLINTCIEKLTAPECSRLQLLLLRDNSGLQELPKQFFESMHKLVVLDMSNSFTLRLNDSRVSSGMWLVRDLENLQILSLAGSSIDSLPEQLGNLEKLRLLDLSSMESLEIPVGLIFKLRYLEELYVDSSKVTEDLLIEIGTLTQLRCLQLFIKDARFFSQNDHIIFSIDFMRKLKSYIIYTELQWITLIKSHRKNLYLKGVTSIGDWVVDALLGETENLILDSCFEEESTMLHFTALSCISTFRVLKILRLTNCNDLTHLVWCDDQQQSAFHNLEELHITKCESLRSVFHFQSTNKNLFVFPCLKIIQLINLQETVSIWSWEGNPPPQHICPNLKELNVQRCRKLDFVFVARVAAMLSNLERLTLKSNVALKEVVADDYRMEEIVVKHVEMEETVGNEIVSADTRYPAHPADSCALMDPEAFPSLTHLSLVDLPEMEYFYKVRDEIMRFSWKSLVSLKMGGCNSLKGFPIHGASAPGLKNVELVHNGDKSWYQTLISQDASLAERFKTTQE
ncbi:probable disease resistance protein At1g61300 [Oryza glaberrima]|uniref:probable disease resistance protein At1g61300 n=1 Tax=Oryza glaberrima TaxID=4538 RepID=UPI00224C052F|nr:probable disease resistance protein At1g61300 [Oryza glaberrima]